MKILILVVIGLMGMFMPKKYITLGQRWKYKGQVEPSDGYVLTTRVIGFLLTVASLFIILFYNN